jgi:hypothetical protein
LIKREWQKQLKPLELVKGFYFRIWINGGGGVLLGRRHWIVGPLNVCFGVDGGGGRVSSGRVAIGVDIRFYRAKEFQPPGSFIGHIRRGTLWIRA